MVSATKFTLFGAVQVNRSELTLLMRVLACAVNETLIDNVKA